MTVYVTAVTVIPPPQPPPELIEVSISLSGQDGRILRSMLGALTRAERRAATRRNGGSKDSGNRARFLVKEIIDALDRQGCLRLDEVPITPPDQQEIRAQQGLGSPPVGQGEQFDEYDHGDNV